MAQTPTSFVVHKPPVVFIEITSCKKAWKPFPNLPPVGSATKPHLQRTDLSTGSRLFSSLLNWVCPNGNKASPDWCFIVDLNPKRRIGVFFRRGFYKNNPEFQGRLVFFMVGLTYRVTSDWFCLKIGDHRKKKILMNLFTFGYDDPSGSPRKKLTGPKRPIKGEKKEPSCR